MFDLFDKVIEFNHNPTSESAKRKLDVVRLILRVRERGWSEFELFFFPFSTLTS